MQERENNYKGRVLNAVIIGLLATFVGWTVLLQQEVSELKASLGVKTDAAFGTIASLESSVKTNAVDVEVTRQFQRNVILPVVLPKLSEGESGVDPKVMSDFLSELRDLDKKRYKPVEPLEGESLKRYIEQREMIQRTPRE